MLTDARRAGRIAVLPDHIVDQIAAGEVVERPASVVKELVENALDAGATHIVVEVEGGGRKSIRVVDNGSGMSPTDARLALARHATSKLRAIDDLYGLGGIGTMGFRGEALPSIAAVSRLTLTSRTGDDLAATRLVVDAGRVIEQGEVGAPVGTVIEVRDLLHNVPARLKFLKGEPTEASHITEALARLAMSHPHVHFRLRHGGRTAIDVPLHSDGLARAQALLGTRVGRQLHTVEGEEGGIRVVAYLAPPELAQTTSRGAQLHVGRRAVRDRGLLQALVMGYGELVPRGRYPVAILHVDVPGATVDVNVHPQKLEVRFSDPQAVYAAVRHIVRRGIAEAPWLEDMAQVGSAPVRMHAVAQVAPPQLAPGLGRHASDIAAGYAARAAQTLFGRQGDRVAPRPPSGEPDREGDAGSRPGGAGRAGESTARWNLARPSAPLRRSEPAGAGRALDEVPFPLAPPASPSSSASASASSGPAPRPAVPDSAPATEPENAFFSRLRYLGQLDRTYLLCESEGELILIDQHAAHERVAFQRLRDRYQERAVPVQRLLFPQSLELGTAQVAVAVEAAADLSAVGFEVEVDPIRGPTALSVKAVPAGLRSGEAPTEVLAELLDELAEAGGSRAIEERSDLVLATIACHSVVRAGDTLSPHEAQALLDSMDGVDFRAHCPHGRPVLLRISIAEIARRFGR
jgi:DNA mismatch repair protein MutL